MVYAGGVALNDVCDARRDAVHRPERPIPAGRVSPHRALALAIGLLIGGVALAASFSTLALYVAGALVSMVVLYDAALKRTWLGPALMGLCRALNLALGMTIIPEYRTIVGIVPVLLVMWLYVASITLLARDEHTRSAPWRLRTALAGLIAAVFGLSCLLILVPGVRSSYLACVALLLLIVMCRALPAARRRDPITVQRAVRDLVLALVLFDACIAWAAQGFTVALFVLSWIVPAKAISRMFRVT